MHRPQQQVREFHKRVIGSPVSPAPPSLRNRRLRARLILEEAIETAAALLGVQNVSPAIAEIFADIKSKKTNCRPSLVDSIDGLCDTIVVCYGTAEDIGVDLEPFFDEVMRANMAKAGGPIREDGKQLKPPGWRGPDIRGILERLG